VSRRVCVVTGTRAEYGLLRWLMEDIRGSAELQLQVVAAGMHLAPEFGCTYREIERDGFRIDRKIELLLSSDTSVGISKSIGLGVVGFADALQQLAPDIAVVLGDRFEILAAAVAATIARIPIAHIHGGEASEGAFDESLRHSITKMSHLHFVAAEEYRRRVIQLGEQPERVFLVGGMGVDSICRLKLLDRRELESALGFELEQRNLLITFHPVTLERATAGDQMEELLAAVAALSRTNLIFTMPNADTDGRVLIELINRFVATHPNARSYTSLGQVRYLSCMKHVDAVVGNSSSGLTEAPSFCKGTINIGDRQRGRLKAASVIDCEPERAAIAAAIAKLYSTQFQSTLATVKNPYGEGGASERIAHVLATTGLDGILKKHFHDLPGPFT
jgi:GDP/UDP-N,N'-diacetylbacillosamine 2-epimerase (hydrolysing)